MSTIADDWSFFVQHWCGGTELAYGHAASVRALQALARHWPQRLAEGFQSGGRGIGVVVPLIHVGAICADTHALPGFGHVLARARGGERSALSELSFAALLVRRGLLVQFEPECGGKYLDLAVSTSTHPDPVYIEVIAPELSDRDRAAQAQVIRAEAALWARNGRHLQVEFFRPPSDQDIALIKAELAVAESPDWMQIPDVARFRSEPSPDGSSRTSFRWPGQEHRAGRLIGEEYKHFVDDVPYVLAIDAGKPLFALEGWLAELKRRFQPTRNRRLAAGIVFREYSSAPDFIRRAELHIAANSHATRPVPEALLREFTAIHDPPRDATREQRRPQY